MQMKKTKRELCDVNTKSIGSFYVAAENFMCHRNFPFKEFLWIFFCIQQSFHRAFVHTHSVMVIKVQLKKASPPLT